jgi:hypothetical protein
MCGSGELAIGGVTSGIMKLGDTVTWRARHFGMIFQMTSAITEYQYPSRFVDEQLQQCREFAGRLGCYEMEQVDSGQPATGTRWLARLETGARLLKPICRDAGTRPD